MTQLQQHALAGAYCLPARDFVIVYTDRPAAKQLTISNNAHHKQSPEKETRAL
jgi:hypothetical protein